MKVITVLMVCLGLGYMSFAQSPVGDWEGTLEAPGIKLKIVFHITGDGDAYSATMDSPDQGAMGLPTNSTKFEDGKLTITATQLGMTYEGVLDADGANLKGVFKQGPGTIPLNLTKAKGEPAKLDRPQEPQKPYPYKEEAVKYDNAKAEGVTLAGTLTMPNTNGPHPAVVLISGSGPQNRDEELVGHKPFLILADHLTRQGIAVLRYDDRGVEESTGDFATATSADFATDVEAAVAYLKTRKDIDASKIGLMGHSEGGLIAPMVAAESKDVAYIVLLAGPGVSGTEILLLQQELIAKASQVPDQVVALNRKLNKRTFELLSEHGDDLPKAKEEIKKYMNQEKERLSDTDKAILEASMGQFDQTFQQISSPWFRFFLKYDPATSLEKVSCPVLAINGDKDLQVDAAQNLPAIEKALKKGGNTNYEIKALSNMNHLFQTSETGSPTEYGKLTETFSPTALNTISNWLQTQLK
ncbi:MAG: alpha/beta fold hydrolase [Saprospiraceae bacterium]|nr:alpha/beta fold hydrolase [Saprospiraceae bacterium]